MSTKEARCLPELPRNLCPSQGRPEPSLCLLASHLFSCPIHALPTPSRLKPWLVSRTPPISPLCGCGTSLCSASVLLQGSVTANGKRPLSPVTAPTPSPAAPDLASTSWRKPKADVGGDTLSLLLRISVSFVQKDALIYKYRCHFSSQESSFFYSSFS